MRLEFYPDSSEIFHYIVITFNNDILLSELIIRQ